MTDLEKAARMSLEALESIDGVGDVVRWNKQFEYFGKAITALRQALNNSVEQPAQQQEPVALREVGLTRDTNGVCIVTVNGREAIRDNGDVISHFATLDWFDTSPQRKPWVGLTSQEVYACADESGLPQELSTGDLQAFGQSIEAKLKEKNA